ncbi:TIGR02530 family flagellar biosynthesis protein [Mesobacillus zeae]|uniref:Flagellar protein n=1 Tax=Mesobacillus zeae TaxID=1917180 RepID=A0A398BCS0_9BACI|nr:TIGR02530 family flagellar biosynthesis protein [Mesobacillus zeae]RID87999.1 flagellar protein [Mesobacillus zeae]
MDKPVFRPIHQLPVIGGRNSPVKTVGSSGKFSQHLLSALDSPGKLVLSKHAEERLRQRGISISPERWQRIEDKVNQARDMGIKDSLVLLKDAALIVSAKNNKVITAMNRQEAGEQIFTDINGTIILES